MCFTRYLPLAERSFNWAVVREKTIQDEFVGRHCKFYLCFPTRH